MARRPLFNLAQNLRARSSRGPFRSVSVKWTAGAVVIAGGAYLAHDKIKPFDLEHIRLPERFVAHAEASIAPETSSPKAGAFRKDPETDVEFPIKLDLPSTIPPLHLVGLGVRKVSFLRVKVYSAGFYVEESKIKKLRHIPGWSNFTAQHLLSPPTTKPGDPLDAPQMSGEALLQSLLDTGISCAVKIVPVRNTDFSHLREGFVRALNLRQKIARSERSISVAEETRIADSVQTFKGFFPSGSVPKGKSVTLVNTGKSLIVENEGRILGELQDPWVAKQMMLAYFADKEVISPKLKEDVAQGFEELMK